jgi:hypothetical protein
VIQLQRFSTDRPRGSAVPRKSDWPSSRRSGGHPLAEDLAVDTLVCNVKSKVFEIRLRLGKIFCDLAQLAGYPGFSGPAAQVPRLHSSVCCVTTLFCLLSHDVLLSIRPCACLSAIPNTLESRSSCCSLASVSHRIDFGDFLYGHIMSATAEYCLAAAWFASRLVEDVSVASADDDEPITLSARCQRKRKEFSRFSQATKQIATVRSRNAPY